MQILWDGSELWGCLALWAARSLALPWRLVRGAEWRDKPPSGERPELLFVPGGLARRKALALGPQGLDAVREYVRSGGRYLGFCGGAGLGLSGADGLGLCPWRRGGFAEHMQHFMSGHLFAERAPGNLAPAALPSPLLLPVWWPGRFSPEDDGAWEGVSVLARYAGPGPDFWLADLPVSSLPPEAFAEWEARYGFSLSPVFLRGQPGVIAGAYGAGEYVLSYAHLETPGSAGANAWFVQLLRALGGVEARGESVPEWDLERQPVLWRDAALERVRAALQEIMETGLGAGLFFARTPWLTGWRAGLPGAGLNALRAQVVTILSRQPDQQALQYWSERKERFLPLLEDFRTRVKSYLLAERLAMTLAGNRPETLRPEKLRAERAELFGSGMSPRPGGLYGQLMPVLEELLFRQFRLPEGA